MSGKKTGFSRRDFFKIAAAAGLGTPIAQIGSLKQAYGGPSTVADEQVIVPTRSFGKTGVNVSILSKNEYVVCRYVSCSLITA